MNHNIIESLQANIKIEKINNDLSLFIAKLNLQKGKNQKLKQIYKDKTHNY